MLLSVGPALRLSYACLSTDGDTGALNQGWIADAYSRKYSILMAVIIFTIGTVLQTAAIGYVMLVIARLIGGIGIGMCVLQCVSFLLSHGRLTVG